MPEPIRAHRRVQLACVLLAGMLAMPLLAPIGAAQAKPFRWASDADVGSMDPYGRNESFLLGFLGNIYEPLARRGADLKLEPALALSWTRIAPDTWRYVLRPNVRFHDGSPFSADDVIFSIERARHPSSRVASKLVRLKEARKVDVLTVDLVTDGPDVIFPEEISNLYIMSRIWAERHGATEPANMSKSEEGYATRNANGTGPFMLKQRQPDVETVLVPYPGWWDTRRHNIEEVTFVRIANAATRVAALISGEIDMVYAVPPQDVRRLSQVAGLRLYTTPELRVVFFAMDQQSDVLRSSDVRDRNPFKDKQVRQAFAQAIDIEAIKTKIMRGLSVPVGNLVAHGVHGYDEQSDTRPPFDPEAAKTLLAEAGYPHGFRFTMDCPNDRYVNDSAICQAVAAMLARIGVTADLEVQTANRHFAKVNGGRSDFYLMGWMPTTYDAQNVILNLMMSWNGRDIGTNNIHGITDPAIDALGEQIALESDPAERDALIREALKREQSLMGHLPLHQQSVVWATRDTVHLTPQGDNVLALRLVTVD